jgi:hypothetical protein
MGISFILFCPQMQNIAAFIWAKTNINFELTNIDNVIDDNCLKK